jgi:hypothetical protein
MRPERPPGPGALLLQAPGRAPRVPARGAVRLSNRRLAGGGGRPCGRAGAARRRLQRHRPRHGQRARRRNGAGGRRRPGRRGTARALGAACAACSAILNCSLARWITYAIPHAPTFPPSSLIFTCLGAATGRAAPPWVSGARRGCAPWCWRSVASRCAGVAARQTATRYAPSPFFPALTQPTNQPTNQPTDCSRRRPPLSPARPPPAPPPSTASACCCSPPPSWRGSKRRCSATCRASPRRRGARGRRRRVAVARTRPRRRRRP